jgi:hypothetical protein
MALSTQEPLLVRQKARGHTRKPSVQGALKQFFSYLNQHKGDPNLQLVAFADLTSATGVVIADVACKLYALYLKKPAGSTVAAFVKLTDDAVTVSTDSAQYVVKLPTADEVVLVFHDGVALATGAVIGSYTTVNGATGSVAADQPDGFAIIGAA